LGGFEPVPRNLWERLLYPVVPAVVSAESGGRVCAMLAAWWTQLSFQPFLVGVAVAPERFTYRLIVESGVFGLSFLPFSFVDRTPFLGDVSCRFMPDKLERGGFRVTRGGELGAPLIEGAAAALEARLVKVVETGDHDLVVWAVASAYAVGGFTGIWDLGRYKPLMYLGRTRRPGPVRRVYATIGEAVVREVPYAPGELAGAAERRRRVLEKAVEAARRGGLEAVVEALREEGLDPSDAKYYAREAERAASS